MFTGIIEDLGIVKDLVIENDNLHLTIESVLTPELKIDQSVSHNGVCLTVIALTEHSYTVTAIKETLDKTNLNSLNVGATVNLERGLKLGARLDGHMVQGHVDQVGTCTKVETQNGSWIYSFKYDASLGNDGFSVAIIPYTYEHTNFKHFEVGTVVNLEFDVIGKYVARLHGVR